uniref:(northern house mosquito) hypothetical protein n=1 Tax=Culex pipiens TaxID=7175 RepID=A0A8D8HIJ1_CULPI
MACWLQLHSKLHKHANKKANKPRNVTTLEKFKAENQVRNLLKLQAKLKNRIFAEKIQFQNEYRLSIRSRRNAPRFFNHKIRNSFRREQGGTGTGPRAATRTGPNCDRFRLGTGAHRFLLHLR